MHIAGNEAPDAPWHRPSMLLSARCWRPRFGVFWAMRWPVICCRGRWPIGAAPVMGWAVHSAATLPIFFLIGFSPLAVVAVAALCVAVSRRDAQACGERRCRGRAGDTMVGVRSRGGAGAGAGRGDPAENVRRRGLSRGPDDRSCQDRDDRRHDAAGPAAGRSGFWRRRPARPVLLLLSLALQRRRAGAAAPRQRLGSRYRADVVHRICVIEPADGACGMAQQAIGRRDLGCRACRRGVVAHGA